MNKRRIGRHKVLDTVALATVILAPSHLASIGAKVGAADTMVHTHLSATEAREKRFGLIGASLAVAVALAVIDALRQEASVKLVPPSGFVRMDGGAEGDAASDH